MIFKYTPAVRSKVCMLLNTGSCRCSTFVLLPQLLHARASTWKCPKIKPTVLVQVLHMVSWVLDVVESNCSIRR